MGTEPLKVVVVGVGHLGRHHARLLKEVPGAELAGIVDADAARAREIAGALEVPVLADLDAIPDDVRAASVAVPTSLHHAVVTTLLERGLHVLVEKPMAASVEEARELAELAAARGLQLQVGHIERFNPALAVFRRLGVTPRFIEAHRLAPFNYRTLDTSVVMDLMIHDLDLVLDIAGAPLTDVDAVGSRVLGQHVDIASARLHFGNGCVANVTASRVSFEPLRRLRVFADEAFCTMDLGSRRAFVVKKAPGFDLGSLDAAAAERIPPKASFKEFLAQGLMEMEEVHMDEANPLLEELSAFVASVRGEGQGAVPATAGLAAMEAAQAVMDSIAAHHWS